MPKGIYRVVFFLLFLPNFGTKKKMANQPIIAAVSLNLVNKKGCDWLIGGFLFGTEIGKGAGGVMEKWKNIDCNNFRYWTMDRSLQRKLSKTNYQHIKRLCRGIFIIIFVKVWNCERKSKKQDQVATHQTSLQRFFCC